MIRLSEEEFTDIVAYVGKRYGVNLKKKKVLIECRLKSQLEKYGSSSFGQYFAMVQKNPTGKMAEEMIGRLTTHYTYFLREAGHFDYIRNKILPELSAKKGGMEYKIWCAGCSTGEECYTLAMVIEDYRQEGNWLPDISILGTDLSENILNQAESGIYQTKELEKIPNSWQNQYLNMHKDGAFELKPRLRKQIRYKKQNLMELDQGVGSYHLIICRNVMIYFEAEAKKKLIAGFEKALYPGGWLLVGHAELLQSGSTNLTYEGNAVYRKQK